MYKIKTEDVYEDFSKDKKMFHFSNLFKIYFILVIYSFSKMKDEIAGVPIEEFVGFKPKMYSFLVGVSSEHKKVKGVNKNVVATISHNEYKDILLNQKCLIHSINRTQCKNHRIETYEINKSYLFCFDDKTYIQNNGHDK